MGQYKITKGSFSNKAKNLKVNERLKPLLHAYKEEEISYAELVEHATDLASEPIELYVIAQTLLFMEITPTTAKLVIADMALNSIRERFKAKPKDPPSQHEGCI